jgi:tRNA threonylcarbamoyladenosine biosynthesis protein TsaB
MTRHIQLAIDASAGPASVALFVEGELAASRRIDRAGSAELLAPTIATLLHATDLHAADVTDVIVGAGPGSFTGLRVAAALGKGLARGSGARLHVVSSLGLIAAANASRPGEYVAILDALRGEWFAQTARCDTRGVWTVSRTFERAIAEVVRARATAVGATLVGPPVQATELPDASAALRVGFTLVDRDTWEPDYGRLAEAQVVWETANARPLPAT